MRHAGHGNQAEKKEERTASSVLQGWEQKKFVRVLEPL